MNKSNFKKKVYRQLSSDQFSPSIHPSAPTPSQQTRTITRSKASQNVRETFKQTFLPLLIEIFELRQSIESFQSQDPSLSGNNEYSTANRHEKTLKKLQQLHAEIEESQQWCHGIILQIQKGIEEATEALERMSTSTSKPTNIIKRILKRIKKCD